MSSTSQTAQSGVNNATTQSSLASLLAVSDNTSGFGTTVQPVAQTQNDASTYAFIVGWVVFIAFLALFGQTQTGHNIIYYGLILIITVLVLTQYQRIVTLLAPVGQEIPQG